MITAANAFSGDVAPLWAGGLFLITAFVAVVLYVRWDDRGRARQRARDNAAFFKSMELQSELHRAALAADLAIAKMAREQRQWERSRPIGFHSRYRRRKVAP